LIGGKEREETEVEEDNPGRRIEVEEEGEVWLK